MSSPSKNDNDGLYYIQQWNVVRCVAEHLLITVNDAANRCAITIQETVFAKVVKADEFIS